MDLHDAREHVRRHHHAVLLTTRRDGAPQMSPVLAGVDLEGRVLVSAQRRSAKVHNLLRDPRAWLCVFPEHFYGAWVQVGGRVEVLQGEAALAPLEDYYRSVSGEHPDWAAYREAMVEDERVLLRLRLESAGPG